MKIYFGGSISGGRGDQETYGQIIAYLKNFGEVLTEFIGNTSLSSWARAIWMINLFTTVIWNGF